MSSPCSRPYSLVGHVDMVSVLVHLLDHYLGIVGRQLLQLFLQDPNDRSHAHLGQANTSRGLKSKFPFLKDAYWGTDSIWSAGYFVSTVGANEEVIRRYIMNQGTEDAGQAKLVI
jgi:putative transposase